MTASGASTAPAQRVVALEIRIDASPETVFDFFIDPGKMIQWMGRSTVEVTLAPDGDGTLVRLVHRELPTDESRAAHHHGWEHYTGRLATAAAGDDPGPDPWATPTND